MLVRRETNPDDLEGMIAAAGILTSRGGKTSHAAVVARGMGKTVRLRRRGARRRRGRRVRPSPVSVSFVEGDVISIDGSTGEVFLGADAGGPVAGRALPRGGPGGRGRRAPTPRPPSSSAPSTGCCGTPTRSAGCGSAPTPTPPTTRRARPRTSGREGIGLCRTEHMFLGDRRVLIERVILAGPGAARDEALAALLPLQRQDFLELLEAMDGLPTTIRLLDPPLHEFLPDRAELMVRVALAEERGAPGRGRPPAARRGRAAARVQPDARSARGPARAGRPWPVRPAGAGHRRGGRRADQGGRPPQGRDHGAARRFGDGAAPRARRDRRHRRRGRRDARASRSTSRSAP